MMMVPDPWGVKMPSVHHVHNGRYRLATRLVWATSLFFRGKGFYLSRECRDLISERYGESLSTQVVAYELKQLSEMGFLERELVDSCNSHFYKYRWSPFGRDYLRREFDAVV